MLSKLTHKNESISVYARFLMLVTIGTALGWSSITTAMPITYKEVFGKNLGVNEGQRAVYNFDLGDTGGSSFIKSGGNKVGSIFLPTSDETRFDNSHLITSALLSFRIGGKDGGNFQPREKIKIKVTGENGTGATIYNETVYLGIDTFDFNLTGNWLDWVSDGKLRTVAIAVNRNGYDNDFKIRRASLTVEAKHVLPIPVPEPTSLFLLATGILGLIFWKKRQTQN